MGYTWLNVASLVLGLAAWILPIIGIAKHSENWSIYAVFSLGACVLAVFFQTVYQNYLVRIEDWSAIMDTSWGVVFASAVLIGVAFLLNLLAFAKYRRSRL
ncbi:MAG: hypothetical protein FWG65_12320 [Turicibacter sp.]|nr:hypothetical protein [Turicibacter sp.]